MVHDLHPDLRISARLDPTKGRKINNNSNNKERNNIRIAIQSESIGQIFAIDRSQHWHDPQSINQARDQLVLINIELYICYVGSNLDFLSCTAIDVRSRSS